MGDSQLQDRHWANQSTKPYFSLWYKGHRNSHSLSICVPGTVLDVENLQVTETDTRLEVHGAELLRNGGAEMNHPQNKSSAWGRGKRRAEKGKSGESWAAV